jgi:hypothetical protein
MAEPARGRLSRLRTGGNSRTRASQPEPIRVEAPGKLPGVRRRGKPAGAVRPRGAHFSRTPYNRLPARVGVLSVRLSSFR